MGKDLLFEMIVEDLPPSEIDEMIENFRNGVEREFKSQELEHGEFNVFYTIRRFGFLMKDVADRQKDRVIEKRGPSTKIAFDEYGKPTKALEGFLKSNSGNMEDIETRKTDMGEYVFLKKKIDGKPAEMIIPGILEKIIHSLRFKKPMRWGKGEYVFIRPPHNLVCILGEKVLDVELFGLKSSSETFGLRFFGSGVSLKSPDEYEKKMEENHVIVHGFT